MLEADIELHAHNIVALRSDLETIRLALSTMSNRQRPKVRPEHLAHRSDITAQQGTSPKPDSENDEPGAGQNDSTVPPFINSIDIAVERTFVHFRGGSLSEVSTV